MRNILNFYLSARHHPTLYEIGLGAIVIDSGAITIISGAIHKKGSKSSMDLLPLILKHIVLI